MGFASKNDSGRNGMKSFIIALIGVAIVGVAHAQSVGQYRGIRDVYNNNMSDAYNATSYINNYVLSGPSVYVSASVPASVTVVYFASSAGCDFRVRPNGVAPVVSATNVTNGSGWMLNPLKGFSSIGVTYFGLQSDNGTSTAPCTVTMTGYGR